MHTDIIEERWDGQRYKGNTNTYTHRERARQINSRGRGRQGERGTDIGGRRGQWTGGWVPNGHTAYRTWVLLGQPVRMAPVMTMCLPSRPTDRSHSQAPIVVPLAAPSTTVQRPPLIGWVLRRHLQFISALTGVDFCVCAFERESIERKTQNKSR